MELMFPWAIYVGIPVLVLIPFLMFRKKDRYKKGKKAANTSYVEETPLYKRLVFRYRVLTFLSMFCLWIAIAIGFLMLSRPAKVDTITEEIRNRDIFLCMDISSSVDQLNYELCDELEQVVRGLKGERFGISIFNARSVILVPLTTDYEYVIETLHQLKESFAAGIQSGDYSPYSWEDPEFYQTFYYKFEGTFSDYGSSLIGDGLASCLFSFRDLEENPDRARVIVFSTDNQLNGVPLVTVERAAELCEEHDVDIFAIAPDNVVDEDYFARSIEGAGGTYYRVTEPNAVENLIADIEATETSILEIKETRVTENPEKFFVWILLFAGLHMLFGKLARR